MFYSVKTPTYVILRLTRNPATFSNACQLADFSVDYQFSQTKILDTDFLWYNGF